VDVPVEAPDLGAERSSQRHRVPADEGDVPAELAHRGGDLAADPAGPDHDDALGAPHGRGEAVGVTPAAEVADAVEVGPGKAQAARRRAGGEQQPLVAEALSGRELELAPGRVDGADPCRGVQLDVVGGVEGGVVDVERVPVGFGAQVRLGQRRAVVGPLGLLAEQDQAALEALGP
jgi:hypothetical protein